MAFKKLNSQAAWDTFMDGLAEAIAKDSDQKKDSILKTMRTREVTQWTHRHVTWVFDNSHQGPINFVEVDDGVGQKRIVLRNARRPKRQRAVTQK
jgi:hypothetical protein